MTQPSFKLPDAPRVLVIPAFASTVSALHERIERHGGDHRCLGPDGERLARHVKAFVAQVQAEVAETTLPYESPPRRIRPDPTRGLVAEAAVATLNGMARTGRAAVSATGHAAASAAEPLRDPMLRRNLREVVPSIIADAARNDLARLDAFARPAAVEAGRRAAEAARIATAVARARLASVQDRLAPLAKFAKGATVLTAGNAAPASTGRVLRALAVAAVVGGVAFSVVGHAGPAWGQGNTRVAVAAQAPDTSIDALFGAAFGNVPVRKPSVPGMASTAPAPAAVPAPVAAPAPAAAPAVRPPAPVAALPSAPDSPAAPGLGAVRTAPSSAFMRIAEATLGTSTGDFRDAEVRVGGLATAGRNCALGLAHITDCRGEADGITMDFVNGVHRAVLKPVKGYSAEPRVVAEETPGGGLRIVDREAMDLVMHEARSYDIKESVTEVESDEPEPGPEAGAPRP